MNTSCRLHRPQVLLGALIVGGFFPAARAALLPVGLEELTRRSEYVVCGQVLSTKSYWGDFLDLGPVILTDVRIQVTEVWKGQPGREVTLQCLGGRIGERWQLCPDAPRFEAGEKVLVFARRFNGALWATGWKQGKYRLVATPAGTDVEGRPQLPITERISLAGLRDRVHRLAASSDSSRREVK